MPNKAVAAGGAGAVTVILVWLLGLFHLSIPPEVASAFTTLIAGAATYITPSEAG